MNKLCDDAIVRYSFRGPLNVHKDQQIRQRVGVPENTEHTEPLIRDTGQINAAKQINEGPMHQLYRGLLRRDQEKRRREMGAMRREMKAMVQREIGAMIQQMRRGLTGSRGPPQDLEEDRPVVDADIELVAIDHAPVDAAAAPPLEVMPRPPTPPPPQRLWGLSQFTFLAGRLLGMGLVSPGRT